MTSFPLREKNPISYRVNLKIGPKLDWFKFNSTLHRLIEITKELAFEKRLPFLKGCNYTISSKMWQCGIYNGIDIINKFCPPPKKVLDFGCGIGIQATLLSRMGYKVDALDTILDKSIKGFFKKEVSTFIESREESLKAIWALFSFQYRNINFKFYDGKKIPFDDASFDVVVAYAVIEHIPRDEIVNIIQEIRRVLKNSGYFFIFQLPSKTSLTEHIAQVLGIPSHEDLWDSESIKKLMRKNGLKTVREDKTDMLFNHPYYLVNPFFPILNLLNRILLKTSFKVFAHHLLLVTRKI